jgi:hypothetical protein
MAWHMNNLLNYLILKFTIKIYDFSSTVGTHVSLITVSIMFAIYKMVLIYVVLFLVWIINCKNARHVHQNINPLSVKDVYYIPTSRYILFDGENIFLMLVLLFIYINSTTFHPIMIINRIYEHQNLLSL